MNFSVALPSTVHDQAVHHLIREDAQEDLCFALWHPSKGQDRFSALVYKLLLPKPGERYVHGNASFMPMYFERALNEAIQSGCGLAFMHSHPSPGWQNMSRDDITAERGHAAAAQAATGVPFVGLTVGTDGAWSARFWEKTAPRTYERKWCNSVRVVGSKFGLTFHPQFIDHSVFRPELERTMSAWGTEVQACLANLTVGIVGVGSVGALVAESLVRMGIGHIRLLDFDGVEPVNLDRLLHANRADARENRAKVSVIADALRDSATAAQFSVDTLEFSIVEEQGYRAALDCDVLFSCVDRPWPRSVLNFIAYAHLIPVIDGGIQIQLNERRHTLRHADWRAHTAIPTRPCLECLRQYDPGLVASERDGLFDDPNYIAGLPKNHTLKRNENVFAFSMSVASLEVLQFLYMVVSPAGLSDPGAQIYHFVTATLDQDSRESCNSNCLYPSYVALGDDAPITVTSLHKFAENARAKRQARKPSLLVKFWNRLSSKWMR